MLLLLLYMRNVSLPPLYSFNTITLPYSPFEAVFVYFGRIPPPAVLGYPRSLNK